MAADWQFMLSSCVFVCLLLHWLDGICGIQIGGHKFCLWLRLVVWVGIGNDDADVVAASFLLAQHYKLYWFLIDCPDIVSFCARTRIHTKVYSSLKCNHLHYKKKEAYWFCIDSKWVCGLLRNLIHFLSTTSAKCQFMIIILANRIQSRRKCSLCNQQMSEVLTTTMTTTIDEKWQMALHSNSSQPSHYSFNDNMYCLDDFNICTPSNDNIFAWIYLLSNIRIELYYLEIVL